MVPLLQGMFEYQNGKPRAASRRSDQLQKNDVSNMVRVKKAIRDFRSFVVDLPMKHGDFHSDVNVLPEGNQFLIFVGGNCLLALGFPKNTKFWESQEPQMIQYTCTV